MAINLRARGRRCDGQGAPLGQSQGTRPCWEEGKGTLWGSPDSEQDGALAQPLCRVLPGSGSCPKMERAGPRAVPLCCFHTAVHPWGWCFAALATVTPPWACSPYPPQFPAATLPSKLTGQVGCVDWGVDTGLSLQKELWNVPHQPTPLPALSAAQMDLSRPSSGLWPSHLSSLTSIPLATHLTLPQPKLLWGLIYILF